MVNVDIAGSGGTFVGTVLTFWVSWQSFIVSVPNIERKHKLSENSPLLPLGLRWRVEEKDARVVQREVEWGREREIYAFTQENTE